jgi:hypothetical protein
MHVVGCQSSQLSALNFSTFERKVSGLTFIRGDIFEQKNIIKTFGLKNYPFKTFQNKSQIELS